MNQTGTGSAHHADDIVSPEGADRYTPGAITRLERAELNRRNAIQAEMERHRLAMDAITKVFGEEMYIA